MGHTFLWDFTAATSEQSAQRFTPRGVLSGQAQKPTGTARSITSTSKRTRSFSTVRAAKQLAIDCAAIGGTVAAVGISAWGWDILPVPLAASLTHQLVELVGWQVVDAHREQTRTHQLALLKQSLSNPLEEWLTVWPATGGSSFERLQLALRRIPPAVDDLHRRVRTALQTTGAAK